MVILFSCIAIPFNKEASTLTKVAEVFSEKLPADNPHLMEMASTLTVNDISEFLKRIKLADLTELFSEKDVDGSLLLMLEDKDLEDLGVSNGFSRRKIVSKFKAYLVELKMEQGQ